MKNMKNKKKMGKHMVNFLSFHAKKWTFVTHLLFCTPSHFWTVVYNKKKDLTILGGKSFPFRIDLFSEVGQNFDSATSPESVTIRLKRTMVYSP